MIELEQIKGSVMLSGVEAQDEQKNKLATDPHRKTLIKMDKNDSTGTIKEPCHAERSRSTPRYVALLRNAPVEALPPVYRTLNSNLVPTHIKLSQTPGWQICFSLSFRIHHLKFKINITFLPLVT